jgi:nicotinamidase-related amidase
MSESLKAGPRRALVVIDVQNEYDGGSLAIEYPAVGESVANVARAMDAAAAAGIKTVVVKQLAPEASPIFAKGSHGGELHPEAARRKHDHMVEKIMPSAFTGTDLEAWLRANEIDTLVVAGFMTHNCDLSTIIHAVHMGFAVEFLSDATGSVPYANSAGYASAEEIHRIVSIILQSRFAAVVKTADWIKCVNTGALPERDSIYASNQRALKHKAA